MVNGESLGSAPRDCANGDLITVGDNYELYLVLLDPATLGLRVKEHFLPVEADENASDYGPMPFVQNGQQTRDNSYDDPYARSGYVPSNVTVGLDGSSAAGNRGGTVGY